jgi:serine/threonine protein kinase
MGTLGAMAPPLAAAGQEVLSGPERHGSERVWRMRLPDGTAAVLGELLPELAREEALRRRYVSDAERMAALDAPCVARTLAIGPAPDPRDPKAAPPWRLRVDPPGETLETRLARAPLPLGEATDLVARLCDALAEVHARGPVLRDLQPRQVVLDGDRVWLAEVGLARVDLLSTRTASSLILEGSPYASPEHLRATRVDARSDLYSAGVILWRALTGALPFGDGPALFRRGVLPAVAAPAELQALAAALLAERPEARPDSAREVAAALRGQPTPSKALARIVCQGCGASLPAGLRLCLACGKTAVQLVHVDEGARERRVLDLVKLRDEARYLGPLRETLEAVAREPLPRLDFLIGDARYYAKDEKEGLLKLPARLFTDLDPDTAKRLQARLATHGIAVEIRDPVRDRKRRRRGAWTMLASPAWLVAAVAVNPLFIVPAILQLLTGFLMNRGPRDPNLAPVLRLREGPAALPAADPLLLRLSRLLAGPVEADVRDQVTALALCLQGLAERQIAYAPIEPLVALVEKQVGALAALDRELATLDEGAIVRALAASEARREPRSARESLLAGLDRLRSLEDLRAAHMQRLLEASSLLRRAAAVSRSAEPIEEALALLEPESTSSGR